MAKDNTVKKVKDIGWDHISLSNRGFKGAVQEYPSEKGVKVAVCFNMHEAFIVEDDQGLFELDDLVEGVVKEKTIDVEDSGSIEGLSIVAFEDNEEVFFDDGLMAKLGIDAFEVRDSITKRLLLLCSMDKLIDLPL